MTLIDISTDIPSDINTLERLVTWGILALRRVNPTQQVLEAPGGEPERVVQSAIFQADDDSIRFFGRVSIAIEGNYAEDSTSKIWMKAEELSNTILPEAFKQN